MSGPPRAPRFEVSVQNLQILGIQNLQIWDTRAGSGPPRGSRSQSRICRFWYPESAASGYPASASPVQGRGQGGGGRGPKSREKKVLRIGFAWCGKCSHTPGEYFYHIESLVAPIYGKIQNFRKLINLINKSPISLYPPLWRTTVWSHV